VDEGHSRQSSGNNRVRCSGRDPPFHLFSLNKESYLAHYHKRSNVESTFSMVKRKFGDSVRAKTDVAMKNEVLAKFVCHNICCVVSAFYELGINPTFACGPEPELRILRFPGA
jgi:hypothetical protein